MLFAVAFISFPTNSSPGLPLKLPHIPQILPLYLAGILSTTPLPWITLLWNSICNPKSEKCWKMLKQWHPGYIIYMYIYIHHRKIIIVNCSNILTLYIALSLHRCTLLNIDAVYVYLYDQITCRTSSLQVYWMSSIVHLVLPISHLSQPLCKAQEIQSKSSTSRLLPFYAVVYHMYSFLFGFRWALEARTQLHH